MSCPLFRDGWADCASTAYRITLDKGVKESKIENRNIAAMKATKKIQIKYFKLPETIGLSAKILRQINLLAQASLNL
jgi:hypothetical protein